MDKFKKQQLSTNFHKLVLYSHTEQLYFPALSAIMTALPCWGHFTVRTNWLRDWCDLILRIHEWSLPCRSFGQSKIITKTSCSQIGWKFISVAANCEGVENFQLFRQSQWIEKHYIIPTKIYSAHAQCTICRFLRPICANCKRAVRTIKLMTCILL